MYCIYEQDRVTKLTPQSRVPFTTGALFGGFGNFVGSRDGDPLTALAVLEDLRDRATDEAQASRQLLDLVVEAAADEGADVHPAELDGDFRHATARGDGAVVWV